MSRNYANISTAIWRRDEFRALTVGAQHMYLLLTSQPDISAAGVLPLSIRRWSNQTAGATPTSVVAALNELQEHRYIAYDTDTEELLVRSFVRWDGGHTNPKRRPVIQRAAEDVESRMIRGWLAAEFRRLGLPDWLPDSLSDSLSGSPPATEPTAHEEAVAAGIVVDLFPQGNSLSDRQSPSDGVVVTEVSKYPHSTTHTPQPPAAAPLPALPSGEGLTDGQRSKPITDGYAAAVGLINYNAINGIVIKAIKVGRWTDEQIRDALMRLADDNRSVTTETLRAELTGPPKARAAPPRQQTREVNGVHLSDRNIAAAERAERMAALQNEIDQTGRRAIEGGPR